MPLTPASVGGMAVGIFGPIVVARIMAILPKYQNFALGLMVFAMCHIKKPYYQEVFFVLYRGVDRGFGVTVPDVIFLGFFLFIAFGGTKRRIIWWPYNSFPWVAVIIISLISLLGCQVAYYGLFTVHKFVRGLLLYWVIVNIVHSRKEINIIIGAFIAAMIFEGWIVLIAKYVTKTAVNRAVGSFPHPNSLAMYVNLISPIVMSMLLSGALPKKWNKWAILAIASSIICVVFTKSRGALVIMLGAYAIVMFFSFIFKPTWRKSRLLITGMIVGVIFGSIMAPKIIKRFKTAPKESAETRDYFNNAATIMANDHFFGVGLNSYSWMLKNVEKYYWAVYPDKWEEFEDRGDFIGADDFRWSVHGQSRLGTCHHIYLLMAAEIGWIGMWVFIILIIRFYIRNIYFFFRANDWYYKSIALGMLAGLATLHLQGMLEWIFRQTQVFYLFFTVSGLLTAMYNMRLKEIRIKKRLQQEAKIREQLAYRETMMR